jgi:RNA polymerase sigma-70 factor, ECF subfamily
MTPMDEGAAVTAIEVPGADPVPEPRDFRAFFEDEHVGLYRAVWLITRDRHEAEDVMQEAFLRLWQRWERVSRLDDPVGYLYRTAMNVVRSRARRARLVLRRAVGMSSPDDSLAAVEERDALVRSLGALTRRQRAALVLTDVLELTSEEAGRAMGISASTVRVLAARARKLLKREAGESDG